MKSQRAVGYVIVGLACLGASSLVAGVVLRIWPAPDSGEGKSPLLRLDPPVLMLGELPQASNVPLKAVLYNRGDHTINLVGVQMTCTPWGCPIQDNSPIRVPPNQGRQIEIVFRVPSKGQLGPFSSAVSLYTDSAEAARLELGIQGVVVTNQPDS